MQLRTAAHSSRPVGFSLIELMVVVAIAAVLFAIAVPSYVTFIRQSRRTEAKTTGAGPGRTRRALSQHQPRGLYADPCEPRLHGRLAARDW